LSEYIHNGFKVGPNYSRPATPVPSRWIDEGNARVHVGDPNLAAWWDVFDDPILTGLLQRAHSRNLTVRAAGFQILAAKEQRAIAIGELLPQTQGFSLQYTHSKASINQGSGVGFTSAFGTSLSPGAGLAPVPIAPSTPVAGATPAGGVGQSTTTTPTNPSVGSSIGGSVATPGARVGAGQFFDNLATSLNMSWELDFWGLFRRNLEAADSSLEQSVDNYDEMLVLLLANVATEYIEIRTLQRRLELARENVRQQEPLVAAYQKRYQTGIANSFPGYYQLKSNLENTKALIPQLEISLRQANNALCTLLGLPVRDLLPELGDGTVPDSKDPKKRYVRIPRPKDELVVVGIPGDLLLRRPDVQAAESQLMIQSAQIGIAEAEMYPHIGINGTIGLAANSLPHLFSPNSMTGGIGPSLSWNILNYGRLLAAVRLQNFNYQQFVAQYQNTILTANQDAENSLVAYLQTIEQAGHLRESADAASKLTAYLINQMQGGYLPPGGADTSSFINQIFTAVNFQVTQQDSAAQSEGNIALNLVLLYRAMGGGWQIRLTDPRNFCPRTDPDDFSLPVTAGEPASIPSGKETILPKP
jgi:NodT family efflux transporter outer membrane factor (OMF) lipoprotein